MIVVLLCFFSSFYAQSRSVTLIEGDGIGPEISSAVKEIFEAARVPVVWEPVSVAPIKTADGRVTVPDEVISSMEKNKIGLKGACVGACR